MRNTYTCWNMEKHTHKQTYTHRDTLNTQTHKNTISETINLQAKYQYGKKKMCWNKAEQDKK